MASQFWKKWMAEIRFDQVDRFLDSLFKWDRVVEVQEVYVDVKTLFDTCFVCDPSECTAFSLSGRSSHCCRELDVQLTESELETLYEFWPGLKAFLTMKSEYFSKKSLFNDIIDTEIEGDDGVFLGKIREGKKSRCCLSYFNSEGSLLCSVHTLSDYAGLDRHDIMPRACTLFPLSLERTSRGDLVLSAYELADFIEEAGELPCLARPWRGQPVFRYCKNTLVHIFGNSFYDDLEEAYLARTDSERQ